mmetsp:Transcript_21998/g.70240  ORF Transcript_21998/g.70240 Transcript_21998/m.70240 type:complete len:509 (-) Transcript_21998:412-1938(-)
MIHTCHLSRVRALTHKSGHKRVTTEAKRWTHASLAVRGEVKRDRLRRIDALFAIDAHKRVRAVEEGVLERNHHALKVGRVSADVRGHLVHVRGIKRSIALIHDEEGRWVIAMHGEEESERCDGLLPARQLVHVPEPLGGRHRVVLDAAQVRLLGVVQGQVRVAAERMARALGELAVHRVNSARYVVEHVHELLVPLLLDLLEGELHLTRLLARHRQLLVRVLEPAGDVIKTLFRLHVGLHLLELFLQRVDLRRKALERGVLVAGGKLLAEGGEVHLRTRLVVALHIGRVGLAEAKTAGVVRRLGGKRVRRAARGFNAFHSRARSGVAVALLAVARALVAWLAVPALATLARSGAGAPARGTLRARFEWDVDLVELCLLQNLVPLGAELFGVILVGRDLLRRLCLLQDNLLQRLAGLTGFDLAVLCRTALVAKLLLCCFELCTRLFHFRALFGHLLLLGRQGSAGRLELLARASHDFAELARLDVFDLRLSPRDLVLHLADLVRDGVLR